MQLHAFLRHLITHGEIREAALGTVRVEDLHIVATMGGDAGQHGEEWLRFFSLFHVARIDATRPSDIEAICRRAFDTFLSKTDLSVADVRQLQSCALHSKVAALYERHRRSAEKEISP